MASSDQGGLGFSHEGPPHARGLTNVGNACFLNCVLQGLASLHDVHRWVEDVTATWRELDTKGIKGEELIKAQQRHLKQTTLARALAKTFRELMRPGSDFFEPSDVINHPAVRPLLENKHQDAQELMNVLLREFDEENANTVLALNAATLRHPEESPYTLLPGGRDGQALGGSSIPLNFPRKTFSALHNPFNGNLIHSTLCFSCSSITNRTEVFNTLSLPVPNDAKIPTASIELCLLANSTLGEAPDAHCEACRAAALTKDPLSTSSLGRIISGTRLLKAPRALCLHLKRVGLNAAGKPEKIRTPVTYGLELSLNAIIAKEYKNPKADLTYQLEAIIVHTGVSHSGNFMTLRRVPAYGMSEPAYKNWIRGSDEPMRWIMVSDRTVRAIRTDDALAHSANVYMLFYSLKAPTPAVVPLVSLQAERKAEEAGLESEAEREKVRIALEAQSKRAHLEAALRRAKQLAVEDGEDDIIIERALDNAIESRKKKLAHKFPLVTVQPDLQARPQPPPKPYWMTVLGRKLPEEEAAQEAQAGMKQGRDLRAGAKETKVSSAHLPPSTAAKTRESSALKPTGPRTAPATSLNDVLQRPLVSSQSGDAVAPVQQAGGSDTEVDSTPPDEQHDKVVRVDFMHFRRSPHVIAGMPKLYISILLAAKRQQREVARGTLGMAFVKRQALEARRDEVALRQMRVLRKLSALDLELAVTHEGQEQVGEARRGGVEMLIKSRELEEMAEVNKRKRAVELERFKQEAAKEDEIKRLEDEEQVRAMEAAAPTPEILAKVLKQWPDAPPESVVTSLCEIRRRLRGLLDNEAEERQRLQREERELLRELLNCGWELVLDERELPKDTSHALSVHKGLDFDSLRSVLSALVTEPLRAGADLPRADVFDERMAALLGVNTAKTEVEKLQKHLSNELHRHVNVNRLSELSQLAVAAEQKVKGLERQLQELQAQEEGLSVSRVAMSIKSDEYLEFLRWKMQKEREREAAKAKEEEEKRKKQAEEEKLEMAIKNRIHEAVSSRLAELIEPDEEDEELEIKKVSKATIDRIVKEETERIREQFRPRSVVEKIERQEDEERRLKSILAARTRQMLREGKRPTREDFERIVAEERAAMRRPGLGREMTLADIEAEEQEKARKAKEDVEAATKKAEESLSRATVSVAAAPSVAAAAAPTAPSTAPSAAPVLASKLPAVRAPASTPAPAPAPTEPAEAKPKGSALGTWKGKFSKALQSTDLASLDVKKLKEEPTITIHPPKPKAAKKEPAEPKIVAATTGKLRFVTPPKKTDVRISLASLKDHSRQVLLKQAAKKLGVVLPKPTAKAEKAGATPASSSMTVKSAAVFSAIAQRVESDPSLVQKVNGVIHFKIEAGGESHSWTLDLKNDNGSVAPSAPEQADLTVTLQDQDFVDLFTGQLPGQQAVAQGKLKMAGDMALAQKFSRIVSAAVSTVRTAPTEAAASEPPKEEAKASLKPIAKQEDLPDASPPKEEAKEAPSTPVAHDVPAASASMDVAQPPAKVESSEPEQHDSPAALSAQSVDDDAGGAKLASRISSVSIEERKDSGSMAVPSEHPSPAIPREGSTAATVTKDEQSVAAEEPLEEIF